MASAEEGPEPLKYQVLTLKVSIHCEGCKKKVKTVLQSIEGVYKTTIDSQQQKVVVAGNVEAEILIKKLLKTGKHAELWPEKKPDNPGNNNSGGGGGKKNKNKNKASGKQNEPSENADAEQTPKASGGDSSPDSSAKPEGEALKNSPKADKKEAGSSPPPQKQDGGAAGGGGGGGGSGGGGGGKKKGKKRQKENNGGGGGGEAQAVSEEMGSKAGGGGVVNLPAFNYPMYQPSQLPPAYAVSYSSVQPSVSYGGAYYPMPMTQNSSYFYPGTTVAAAPGSYYIFSDENANACRVM